MAEKYKGDSWSNKKRQLEDGERLCVTVPEAAKMIGISRNHAYEMVKTHQLPVIRFGKRIVIPKALLKKMLEKGESENERTY
jgi:excisionase family DNA binding protein